MFNGNLTGNIYLGPKFQTYPTWHAFNLIIPATDLPPSLKWPGTPAFMGGLVAKNGSVIDSTMPANFDTRRYNAR